MNLDSMKVAAKLSAWFSMHLSTVVFLGKIFLASKDYPIEQYRMFAPIHTVPLGKAPDFYPERVL